MVSTPLRRNKVRTSRHQLALGVTGLLSSVLIAIGCGADGATARGVAERFLDAHYVAIDLDAALPFTSGLARTKVERERALVQGFPIDAATRKPQVWYRLLEERPLDGEVAQLLYRGTMSPEGVERFEQRWLLTVRREANVWIVSNFEELPD
jgi:hypothetical protein